MKKQLEKSKTKIFYQGQTRNKTKKEFRAFSTLAAALGAATALQSKNSALWNRFFLRPNFLWKLCHYFGQKNYFEHQRVPKLQKKIQNAKYKVFLHFCDGKAAKGTKAHTQSSLRLFEFSAFWFFGVWRIFFAFFFIEKQHSPIELMAPNRTDNRSPPSKTAGLGEQTLMTDIYNDYKRLKT